MITVQNRLSEAQEGLFGESQLDRTANIRSDHLNLDLLDLQILRIASKARCITSKDLAKKIHLSWDATRVRAQKLVELNLLHRNDVPSAKKGMKPTYWYSPANDLPEEAVEDAISKIKSNEQQLKQKIEPSNLDHTFVAGNRQSSSHRSASKPGYTKNQVPDLSDVLLKLKPQYLQILEIVSVATGITSKEIQEKTGRSRPTTNNRLLRLLNLNLLTRKKSSPHPSVTEYVYFLTPGLTREKVDDSINKSKQLERNLENTYTMLETNSNSTSDSVTASNGSVAGPLFQKSESTLQSRILKEDDAEHIQAIKWLKQEVAKKELEMEKLQTEITKIRDVITIYHDSSGKNN